MGRVMLRLGSRRASAAAWFALTLALCGVGTEALLLVRAQRVNSTIASGVALPDDPAAPPEQRFAHAFALAATDSVGIGEIDRTGANGGIGGTGDAALHRYAALHADPKLGLAARYNGANLLLRHGMALHAAGRTGQALALIELAKEGYRDVLRRDPQDWPARYNLERAQRLVPDPQEIEDEEPADRRNAERAVTTMRGFAPGLP